MDKLKCVSSLKYLSYNYEKWHNIVQSGWPIVGLYAFLTFILFLLSSLWGWETLRSSGGA